MNFGSSVRKRVRRVLAVCCATFHRFGHTPSACHAKNRCPLDSDEVMLRMSGAQLLRHLQQKGMFGESEKEKMTMSRKSELRSVMASEVESQEPEKKRLKKERRT